MKIETINFSKNFNKPEIKIEESSKHIYLGTDDRLPYQILNYYTNSSINRAIIQRKTMMFIGNGVSFDSSDNPTIDKNTEKFLNNVNPNQSMDEFIEKIGLDLFLYGGSYVQIIWSKNGKKIAEMYNMPFHKMRSGDVNKYNIVEKYYYNPSNKKEEEFGSFSNAKLVEFDAFNTNSNKNKPQILFIKKAEASNPYYPLPDYISCLTDLDTDVEISNFHNSSLYNGFNPGLMIMFTGVEPSPQEKEEFMKKINKTYKGSDNANRVIVFFNDGENPPKIEQLDVNEIDKKFEQLQKTIVNNIVSSHQIPRALASLEQPGSLGNTKELIAATQIFIKNYIEPHQQLVLKYINKIMNINKLNELYIVNPNSNIYMYSLSELKDYLTQTEIRNFLGYEEIENENENIEEKSEDVNVDVKSNEGVFKKLFKKIIKK